MFGCALMLPSCNLNIRAHVQNNGDEWSEAIKCLLYSVRVLEPQRLWLTDWLTPWSRVILEKLTVFSASHEILHLLWNPKIHYYVHKSPPLILILSQMSPVHTFPPCLHSPDTV
jgi:hypothetical protein